MLIFSGFFCLTSCHISKQPCSIIKAIKCFTFATLPPYTHSLPQQQHDRFSSTTMAKVAWLIALHLSCYNCRGRPYLHTARAAWSFNTLARPCLSGQSTAWAAQFVSKMQIQNFCFNSRSLLLQSKPQTYMQQTSKLQQLLAPATQQWLHAWFIACVQIRTELLCMLRYMWQTMKIHQHAYAYTR